jgi:hypothetical protein
MVEVQAPWNHPKNAWLFAPYSCPLFMTGWEKLKNEIALLKSYNTRHHEVAEIIIDWLLQVRPDARCP